MRVHRPSDGKAWYSIGVLGLLWNVGFNYVPEAALPVDVRFTCYADDTLLVWEEMRQNTQVDRDRSGCGHYKDPRIRPPED